jgi:Flp pilus assembly protein TadG
MSQKPVSFRGAKKGAAAVEFALILPLFLTLLFCTLDYGWMFFQQLAITSAAREGARAGALAPEGSTNTEVRTLVGASVNSFLTANTIPLVDATTTTTITAASGSTPATVSVKVELVFRPIVGVFFLPSGAQPYPAKLTSTAVTRREF